MNNQISSNKPIFGIIILAAAITIVTLYGMTINYQATEQRAGATLTAGPPATAEALEFRYQKGLGYIHTGRWLEAKGELEAVFEIDPNYRDVQNQLQEVYAKVADAKPSSVSASSSSSSHQATRPASAEIPADGLVAYYPFDGNADDKSGYGNHGIIHGPVLTADRFDRQDQAFYFNGQGDFIEIPDAGVLNPAQLSISVWAMIDPAASSDDIDIVSKDGEIYERQYLLTRSVKGHFRAHVGKADGGFCWYDGTLFPAAQRWYHLVQTWDGKTLKLYVDGVAETATFSSVDRTGATVSSQPLRIGGGAPPGQKQLWFKGAIDDIRIYDRALVPTEVRALYDEAR
jgi:hypothetical protein